MSRETFSPAVELALGAGLPSLVDHLVAELPGAFAPLADDYRAQVLAAGERWARELLAAVLARQVHVQAGDDVDVTISIK